MAVSGVRSGCLAFADVYVVAVHFLRLVFLTSPSPMRPPNQRHRLYPNVEYTTGPHKGAVLVACFSSFLADPVSFGSYLPMDMDISNNLIISRIPCAFEKSPSTHRCAERDRTRSMPSDARVQHTFTSGPCVLPQCYYMSLGMAETLRLRP